jgi:hypothetical protein
MSTATVDTIAATPTRPTRQRVWRVVRLQLVAPSIFVGIPWLILVCAWAVSMVVGVLVHISTGTGPGDAMRYSWAVLSPQWYLAVVGVQAISLTFQYALGLSCTRREYWLGTLSVFGMLAVVNGIAFAALTQVEKATGGWWLDIRMFDALWYGTDGWWADAYSTAVLSFTVLTLGAAATTVYMRWRMLGVVLTAIGAALLLLAVAAAITLTESWPTVLNALGSLGVVPGFSLVLVLGAGFALVGYAVIRRATPRS